MPGTRRHTAVPQLYGNSLHTPRSHGLPEVAQIFDFPGTSHVATVYSTHREDRVATYRPDPLLTACFRFSTSSCMTESMSLLSPPLLGAAVLCLLSPVSCLLSPVSCLLSPVSCLLASGFWLLASGLLFTSISAFPVPDRPSTGTLICRRVFHCLLPHRLFSPRFLEGCLRRRRYPE
jgi:hypothetical protein